MWALNFRGKVALSRAGSVVSFLPTAALKVSGRSAFSNSRGRQLTNSLWG